MLQAFAVKDPIQHNKPFLFSHYDHLQGTVEDCSPTVFLPWLCSIQLTRLTDERQTAGRLPICDTEEADEAF